MYSANIATTHIVYNNIIIIKIMHDPYFRPNHARTQLHLLLMQYHKNLVIKMHNILL